MFETNGYLGFTFAGRHSSEFGLLVVSDGSRYHQNLSSQFSDITTTVPGKNGSYYFGTQIGNREFEINCVFDNITSHTMHKIQQWLYPNAVGWLIFDEQPYKKYLVKLSSVPNFSFLPFDELKFIEGFTFQKEILKGEVNFSFYTIQEYGVYNPEYEIPKIKSGDIISQQTLDSGLIPSNYKRKNIYLPNEVITNINSNDIFSLYNAGNGIAKADFHILVGKNISWPLEIKNLNDGMSYIITNPLETIKKKYNNVEDIYYYRIQILSSKQEIYAIGLNELKEEVTDKINIGAHYNHFFPKVYHTKPTEILMFTQVVNDDGSPEPLFYTFTYDEKDLGSSDNKDKIYTFEEFQKYWNDYTILTEYNTFYINNIISPAVIFIDYPEDYDYIKNVEKILYKNLCYLVYPNKYNSNNNLIEFIAEYDHTYI